MFQFNGISLLVTVSPHHRLLGMSLTDREVLLALYRATGGPQWSRNNGWDTLADISSWYGVQVRDGHVVGLNLSKNNLQGDSPSHRP